MGEHDDEEAVADVCLELTKTSIRLASGHTLYLLTGRDSIAPTDCYGGSLRIGISVLRGPATHSVRVFEFSVYPKVELKRSTVGRMIVMCIRNITHQYCFCTFQYLIIIIRSAAGQGGIYVEGLVAEDSQVTICLEKVPLLALSRLGQYVDYRRKRSNVRESRAVPDGLFEQVVACLLNMQSATSQLRTSCWLYAVPLNYTRSLMLCCQ